MAFIIAIYISKKYFNNDTVKIISDSKYCQILYNNLKDDKFK